MFDNISFRIAGRALPAMLQFRDSFQKMPIRDFQAYSHRLTGQR